MDNEVIKDKDTIFRCTYSARHLKHPQHNRAVRTHPLLAEKAAAGFQGVVTLQHQWIIGD